MCDNEMKNKNDVECQECCHEFCERCSYYDVVPEPFASVVLILIMVPFLMLGVAFFLDASLSGKFIGFVFCSTAILFLLTAIVSLYDWCINLKKKIKKSEFNSKE